MNKEITIDGVEYIAYPKNHKGSFQLKPEPEVLFERDATYWHLDHIQKLPTPSTEQPNPDVFLRNLAEDKLIRGQQPKEKKERIEVLGVSFDKEPYDGKWGNVIKVYVPYMFNYESDGKDKIPAIQKAIEEVLNDDFIYPPKEQPYIKLKYTQEQMDKAIEEAFIAGREGILLADMSYVRYPTVHGYVQSINKKK